MGVVTSSIGWRFDLARESAWTGVSSCSTLEQTTMIIVDRWLRSRALVKLPLQDGRPPISEDGTVAHSSCGPQYFIRLTTTPSFSYADWSLVLIKTSQTLVMSLETTRRSAYSSNIWNNRAERADVRCRAQILSRRGVFRWRNCAHAGETCCRRRRIQTAPNPTSILFILVRFCKRRFLFNIIDGRNSSIIQINICPLQKTFEKSRSMECVFCGKSRHSFTD